MFSVKYEITLTNIHFSLERFRRNFVCFDMLNYFTLFKHPQSCCED